MKEDARQQVVPPASLAESSLPDEHRTPNDDHNDPHAGLPIFPPLPEAVEAGTFGITEAGPVCPDADDIESLTKEHANEMVITLADVTLLERCIELGVHPRTRQPYRERYKAVQLERDQQELRYLSRRYEDCVCVFREAFGEQAAASLDAWVREQVATWCDVAISVQRTLF